MRDGDFDRLDDAGRFCGMDLTAVFNLVSACPVVFVPTGLSKEGLPTGMQIVGRRFQEEQVLQIAQALEQAVCGFPAAPWPIGNDA